MSELFSCKNTIKIAIGAKNPIAIDNVFFAINNLRLVIKKDAKINTAATPKFCLKSIVIPKNSPASARYSLLGLSIDLYRK
jgi:hypothetical protein